MAPYKRILVTGGAGFIGSWIIRTLLNEWPDCHVMNLDALTYAGNLENLSDIENNPRYEFIHGDIRDEVLLERLMSQADACIHSAAHTHVDRSIDDPAIFTETNVLGTQRVLEAARKAGIQKFVLVSTDEVYGSLDLDSDDLFTEKTPIDPSNPYSASKAGADLLALSYVNTFNFPLCITRCGNNYGPNQYPEKLIPFFLLKIQKGEKVPVYGDGLNVRDWIFVEDHARAVMTVLEKGHPGEVYNISAGQQLNNRFVTKELLAAFSKTDSDENLEFVSDRPAHDRRYALDSSKLRTQLGWCHKTNFQDGLKRTIAWYAENPDWVNNILERERRENQTKAAQWLVNASS